MLSVAARIDTDEPAKGVGELTVIVESKRRVYVPSNTCELDSPELGYSDLITTNGHANPSHIRYELRRVWTVEGTLKPNCRHVYEKRRMYVEEDGW